MSRYLRFGYLVPRAVVLVLLYFTLQYGAGFALRHALIDGGESALGARVELTSARVALLNTSAELRGLQVANPNRPMENLFEADRIGLDFDSDALLRRKGVVQRGSVRGLRFGTARSESGALDESDSDTSELQAPAWLAGAANKAAASWVDQLQGKLSGDLAGQFQSVRLAEAMAERWPARYEQLRVEARRLRSDAERLRSDALEARSNPLRNAELLRSLPQRIASLQGQIDQLHRKFASLPSEMAAERGQVVAARQHDEALLKRQLGADQLDADSLTSFLLGEQVTAPLAEVVAWVRWARHVLPTTKPTSRTIERSRGVDLRFLGVKLRPDLLIRQLDIQGMAELGGTPVELTGLVTDFSTQPSMHSAPLRALITTTGALPLEVRATLDRTGDHPVDELLVDCGTLSLPSLQLGDSKRFGLDVEPTQASLSISLRVEGEQLVGEAQLVQHQVRMVPHLEGRSRLVQPIRRALAERVGHMPSVATRVTLGGTLDRPTTAVWSTLGAAVAESLQKSIEQVFVAEGDRLLAESRSRVDQRLSQLDANIDRLSTALGSELAGPTELLGQITGTTVGRGSLSFEQLGKQLPAAGSLFR